jgi:excinuclease ABC subunit C
MCLAPCFAGCTKEEYDVEVQRLVTFLETGGASLRETLEVERNQSSEAMDFEKAALLHKKLDKLDDALRGQPELPRRLQDLNAVIFQRSSGDQTIGVYEVRAGRIVEPFELSFASLAGDPRSAEQLLRQHLEPDQAIIKQSPGPSPTPQSVIPSLPAQAGEATGGSDLVGRNLSSLSPASQADLSEHLWLLARWFYSNPRQGEIFFRANAWPYRRMMRACARLLAPPEAKPSLPRQNKASQQDNLPQPGEEREKNS